MANQSYLAALIAASMTFSLSTAHSAQDNTDNIPAAEQDDAELITIVAHRQPRTISQVAGTVTIMDQDYIERNIAL